MLNLVYSEGDDILCRDPVEDRTEADSEEAQGADLPVRAADLEADRATLDRAGLDSAADRRTYRRRDSADGAVRTITEAGRDASAALP